MAIKESLCYECLPAYTVVKGGGRPVKTADEKRADLAAKRAEKIRALPGYKPPAAADPAPYSKKTTGTAANRAALRAVLSGTVPAAGPVRAAVLDAATCADPSAAAAAIAAAVRRPAETEYDKAVRTHGRPISEEMTAIKKEIAAAEKEKARAEKRAAANRRRSDAAAEKAVQAEKRRAIRAAAVLEKEEKAAEMQRTKKPLTGKRAEKKAALEHLFGKEGKITKAAAGHIRETLAGLEKERFIAIFENAAGGIVSTGDYTAQSGRDSVIIDCRRFIVDAAKSKAARVTLAHNHCDGTDEPSDIDHEMAKAFRTVCFFIGIKIADNLVYMQHDGRLVSI